MYACVPEDRVGEGGHWESWGEDSLLRCPVGEWASQQPLGGLCRETGIDT